ncbi:MAG: glycosyltransferase family 9 protein [Acidobacteriota bacterium]
MRILIVDTAYLGDLLLATPLIRRAAEISGEGTVDLLTSVAGEAVTRNHPLVGEVHVFRKRGPGRERAGFRRARAWIRSRHPQFALLPRRSFRSALLAALSRVPRRVGFARGVERLLFTDRIFFPASLHQVKRNLSLLRPLGIDPLAGGLSGHPLEVFPSAEDRQGVESWLAERNLTAPGGFYALAPGSAWATKRWPPERFADLASRLARVRPVVMIGGKAERGLAQALLEKVAAGDRQDRLHVAAGVFSPTASAHLLARAAVMVSNDSGALHLGQAAGVPLVALYGPTAPSLGYAPRGAQQRLLGVEGLPCRPCGRHGARQCPEGHWRCMRDLEVSMVERAVHEVERNAA